MLAAGVLIASVELFETSTYHSAAFWEMDCFEAFFGGYCWDIVITFIILYKEVVPMGYLVDS